METNKKDAILTKSLKYETVKIDNNRKYKIIIRLDDNCKNGHQDFSITGDVYRKKDNNWKWLSGGAMGATIAKKYPEFAIFQNLHLCNYLGAPMYAVENGFYVGAIKNDLNYLIRDFRISKEKAKILQQAENEKHFQYLLNKLGIVEDWKKEAKKAISILENLTGKKFEIDSPKVRKVELSINEMLEFKKKEASGYYSKSNIKKRKKEKEKEKAKAKIKELEKEFKKDVTDLKRRFILKSFLYKKISVKDAGMIIYEYNKTIVFNINNYYDTNYTTEKQLVKIKKFIQSKKIFEGYTATRKIIKEEEDKQNAC